VAGQALIGRGKADGGREARKSGLFVACDDAVAKGDV